MVIMTDESGRRPVVVGTDGTRTSDAAVAFAFHEAAARETDLLVVQGCTARTACGDERPDEAAEAVAARLAPWRLRYPEVKVSREIVLDPPGKALLNRTAGARHAPSPWCGGITPSADCPLWTVSKVPVREDQ